jgi:hypothetical protein
LAQEDISLAVNVPAALMDQLAATSQDNPLMAGLMVFLKQMNRITLGMSFNQAANINLAAHFADPAAAQQLSQMLAPMVASMTSKPDTPPFLKQLAITNNANQLNAALALQSQDAMGMLPMLMMGGAGAGEDFPEPDMVGSGPGFAPGVPGGPPQATSVPFSFDGNSTPGAPASPPPGSNPFGETSTPPPPPGSDPFGN